MRRRPLTPLGVAAIALLAGPARDLGAQSAATPRKPGAGTRRPAPVVVAEPDVTAKHNTLTAVVVPVTTSDLTLVTVPLPSGFGANEVVSYTVTALRLGAVVGNLAGFVATGEPPRRIVFALRASPSMNAGRMDIARVRFSTAARTVDVPVIASIAQQRGITISIAARMVAARAGSPVRIGYRLTNTGNAPDTVTVSAMVPPGWRVLDPPVTVALKVREGIEQGVRVLPPPGQGITTLRLVAMGQGRPVAEAGVEVQTAAGTAAAARRGLTLDAGYAAAIGPWEGTNTIQTLELHGPISDGITVRARSASTPELDVANYAFSRAGIGNAPFAMQLASASWRLDAGTLGTTVSDLTGVNLIGRGANLNITTPLWNAQAVRVNPDLGHLDASGMLEAGRLELTPGVFLLSTGMSRLRETRAGSTRALDAWSVGGGVSNFIGGQWGAEWAQRDFDGTPQPGWSGSYVRRTPDEMLDVRYVHAPGGSNAFARATEEFSATANRKLTKRFSITGSAWRSADERGAALTSLAMQGWSGGGRLAVSDRLQLSLTANQNEFGASTALGDFGSAERAFDAAIELRQGGWLATLTASAADLERRTTINDGTTPEIIQRAPRGGARGLIGYGLNGAMFALTGQYERTGPGVGASPVQWSYGIRMNGRPDRPLRFDAAAEQLGGSIEAAQALMIRAGVEVDLPLSSTIRMSAERNPYVVPGPGASDWIYVFGISRAFGLPRLSGGGTRGTVYRDVNGNGRRDAGEAGFAGVMLKRGAEVAVTDNRGSFHLMGNEREPYELDARSLPLGWITPSTVVAPATRAIGAVALSPIEVELALDPADTARVSRAHLADLVVTLRDSTGRQWVSRRTEPNRHVFDAVPPGTYTVLVDASASAEPLRPVGDNPAVVIAGGRAVRPIKIVMRARALRFTNQRRNQP